MTTTGTATDTFTRTDARYLASRIASELEQVHLFYPHLLSAEEQEKYVAEAVELLAYRYMKCADYGFKRNGEWIFLLRYEVRWDGWVVRNDEPGGIPPNINTAGAKFASYMKHTDSYNSLSPEAQSAFDKAHLPFTRTGAPEALLASGSSNVSKTFGRSDVSINRSMYIAP